MSELQPISNGLTYTDNPLQNCGFSQDMCNPAILGETGCAILLSFWTQANYGIGPGKTDFKDLSAYEAALNNYANKATEHHCLLATLVAQHVATAIAARKASLDKNA
ncbi:MAG: hypothetical protein AAB874_07140 [Patescibacteria group bacterium]